MSVLVFAESINNNFKKTAFEACNYGAKLAQLMGTDCIALTNASSEQAASLSNYGAGRIICFNTEAMHDSKMVAALISDVAKNNNSKAVILCDDSRSRALLGRIAVRLDAAVVSSVTSMADCSDGFKVEKSLFSGKAIAEYKMDSDVKLISIARNSIGVEDMPVDANVENLDSSSYASTVQLHEIKRVEGTVPLPEAELVVSAGRGMKGPENWGIIEELAETLGATTACSRPVSDSGWRPHHEHVGQTGIAIKPNLYIAIGISGAIQHLAGVNNSKTIVVINKDPEAPFFKAADYGVVADLFDVVPRLNEAIKKFKAS